MHNSYKEPEVAAPHYGVAIVQLLVSAVLVSALITLIHLLCWRSLREESVFHWVLGFCIELIFAGIAIPFILKYRRYVGFTDWSHWFAFSVMFAWLFLVNSLITWGMYTEFKRGPSQDQRYLEATEMFVKVAGNCLNCFRKVNDRATAQESVYPLTNEIASLGGTVRSFAWLPQGGAPSDAVKLAMLKVDELTKQLRTAIEQGRRNAGDHQEFIEVCDRYLLLIGRIERKEHLKR